MNGPQLKTLRLSQGLSLREVSERLGGEASITTLSRWENSNDQIPQWVSDKLLGSTQLILPLSELHQLLDMARAQNVSFVDILRTAVREYLEMRKAPSISALHTASLKQDNSLNEDPPEMQGLSNTERYLLEEAARRLETDNPPPPGTGNTPAAMYRKLMAARAPEPPSARPRGAKRR